MAKYDTSCNAISGPQGVDPPREANMAASVLQAGDSVGVLAQRWNTTGARIAVVNGLANMNVIVGGQTLRIP